MAARRLREPVVQMRQTLEVVKLERVVDRRAARIRALMLERAMKPWVADRKLAQAFAVVNGGGPDWPFAVAWEVGWKTIYWPHLKAVRSFEEECLEIARPEFELAYEGRPTRLEPLREFLEAVDVLRDEEPTAHALLGDLVA